MQKANIKSSLIIAGLLITSVNTLVNTGKAGKLSENKETAAEQIARAGLVVKNTLESMSNGKYEISRSCLITDFASEEIILTEFGESGYGIYYVSSGSVLEMNPIGISPYSELDSSQCLYIPIGNYLVAKDGGYYHLGKSKMLLDSEILSFQLLSEKCKITYQKVINQENVDFVNGDSGVQDLMIPSVKKLNSNTTNTPIVNASFEVLRSWFFKKNFTQFPDNVNNDCIYIAASLILEYEEVISSTGYFSTAESNSYISWGQGMPGTCVTTLANSFPNGIWGENITGGGPIEARNAINSFLNGKNKQYQMYCQLGTYAQIYLPFDYGSPSIYMGNFPNGGYDHAIVVYGFWTENTNLLCHYGWKSNYSMMIVDNASLTVFDIGGVVSVWNSSPHIHHPYFYYNDFTYCSCGRRLTA
jgi:hypothetical protein